MWDDSHILVAGHTHELASDLATALARILKSHGLHLYIKEAQVSRRYVHANDRVIDYILATGPKPSPKKWDRLVALADILRPEAPFDTDHELWASAVTQELADIDDVPDAFKQVVSDAVFGRSPPLTQPQEGHAGSSEFNSPPLDGATGASVVGDGAGVTNPCSEVALPPVTAATPPKEPPPTPAPTTPDIDVPDSVGGDEA